MSASQSKYTAALAAEICERLSQGETLTSICRDKGVHRSTFHDWRQSHPELEPLYVAAKDAGYDAIADECMRIADTPLEGVEEKMEPVTIPNPDDPDLPDVTEFRLVERKISDMLGHRKLQIETRLKLLAKWDPKRYGDKLDLNHGGKVTTVSRVELVALQANDDGADSDS